MKKIALTLAAAVSAASLNANGMNPLAGLTLGLHGGYSTLDTKVDATGAGPATSLGSFDLSGRGGAGGLNLGYTHMFANKFAIGLEAFGSLSSVKGNFDVTGPAFNGNYSGSFKAKNSMGIALRFGREFSGYMPFVKVGYVSTAFEGPVSRAALIVGNPAASGKFNSRIGGLDLGLGVDCAVTDRVSLGAEFSHQEYQSKSVDIKDATVAATVRQNFKFKPRSNQFMVRLRVRTF